MKQVAKVADPVKPIAINVGHEVDVDSVEETVDGQVISFAALGKVARQPEHNLAANGLRPEHAAEKGHVDLWKGRNCNYNKDQISGPQTDSPKPGTPVNFNGSRPPNSKPNV